jgi:hypothetical protein
LDRAGSTSIVCRGKEQNQETPPASEPAPTHFQPARIPHRPPENID